MKQKWQKYIMAAVFGSIALGGFGGVNAADVAVVKVDSEPAAAVVDDNGDIVQYRRRPKHITIRPAL